MTEVLSGRDLCAAQGQAEDYSFIDWPIALVLASLFFNVPIYLGMFVVEGLTPIIVVSATLVLLLCRQLISRDYLRPIDTSLPIWILSLALLDLWWFVMFGGKNSAIIGPRIVYLVFMLALYLSLAASPGLRKRTLRAIYVGSWLVVPVLLYDVTHPFLFVPPQNEFAQIGRAAAFYINPNQAAAALCAVLLLCWWDLRGLWRWLYAGWIALGIMLTGSRGALVLLPFVYVVMALMGKVSGGELLKLSLVLAFLGICGFLALPYVADYIGIQPEFIISRLLAILDFQQSGDASGDERVDLAAKGIEKFLGSPFVGNGIGSTESWVERSSTHDMFIQLLSDFGVIGGIVLPLLLLMAIVRKSDKQSKSLLSVSIFYVLWGAFSHNLVTEVYLMLAVALAFSSRDVVGDRILAAGGGPSSVWPGGSPPRD